jgi:hypothetical protein
MFTSSSPGDFEFPLPACPAWYRREYRLATFFVSFINAARLAGAPSFSDASGTTNGIFSTWGSARLRSARTRR